MTDLGRLAHVAGPAADWYVMSNPRRGRVTSSKLLPILVAISAALAGCSGGGDVDRDLAIGLEERLAADGTQPEVATCVMHVGRHEIERGSLSEAAIDELLLNCQEAQKVITRATTPAGQNFDEAVVDAALATTVWTKGDDPALDRLWDECEAGTGSACDELFELAPLNSEYESFGLSCGDRPDELHCSELVSADQAELP